MSDQPSTDTVERAETTPEAVDGAAESAAVDQSTASAAVVDDAPPTPNDQPAQRHPFEDLPLEEDGMPSSQDLMNGLRAVVDPEIGYNIVDLGLVYEVLKPEPGFAHVRMTLTSMGCPLTEVIHQQCSVILGAMPGVDKVDVEFTFSPPWDTSMIADYVAEELRAMGMNI